MGDYSYLGDNCRVSSSKNTPVEIGKFCSIADNVVICPTQHPLKNVTTHNQLYDLLQIKIKNIGKGGVKIGNDVWIGANAIILDGVKIGDGAVVGAGAVVTHDVSPYTIVGGVPAKVLKRRFSKRIIKELMEIKWWDWNEEKIKMNKKSSILI
jgi:acetyltransferase-like isoleucine patch superfamily enzyme